MMALHVPGSTHAVVIFGKNPVPGEVKTRLAGRIGPDAAAELYRAFLLDTLQTCRSVKADTRLYLAPSSEPVDKPIIENHPIHFRQSGAGLGDRMSNAFEKTFDDGYSQVCVVGSDHPTLPGGMIEAGFDRLEAGGAVFGPSEDGGYYLVALDRPHPELFERIQYGRPSVLRETLSKAAAASIKISLLERWYDVDTPDDLARLANELRTNSDICPNTRRVMERLQLMQL